MVQISGLSDSSLTDIWIKGKSNPLRITESYFFYTVSKKYESASGRNLRCASHSGWST